MDVAEVFKTIKDKEMEYVGFNFTDALGKLYVLWVRTRDMEGWPKQGIGVSGWPYFVSHEKSDIILKPDMDTFRVLPWKNSGRNVGILMCDIYYADKPDMLEEAPRSLLKKAVMKLKKEVGENANLYCAPEMEFHLIKKTEDGELRLYDEGSYLSPPPTDLAFNLRGDICHAFEQVGINVYKQHQESLRGKHEIDIEYDKAVTAADKVQWAKMVLRKLAHDEGLIATFMPKPFNVPGGAGWHTHASLMDDKTGENLFYSAKASYGISDLGLNFIGGVLRHAKALTAVSNMAVNSYKRLVPGYQAPIYISWARYNRSTLIRIPPSAPKGTRFEYRATDGLCNYYLFFAALIHAGLDGVAKKISPPAPTEENVYAFTTEEKKKKGIDSLPGSLGEALEELKKDEVIMNALEPLTPKFLKLKGEEWHEYSVRIHEWERKKYMEGHFTEYGDYRESGERT